MKTLRCVRVTTVFWLGVTALSCCQIPKVHAEQVHAGHPVWTINLQHQSYVLDELAPPELYEATRQIAFGSDGELVIASAKRSFPDPSEVHAFVIDTKSGKVTGEANWRTKLWPYIFATAKGKYAVVTEGGLVLYSSSLKTVVATSTHSASLASPDGSAFAARKKIPGHGVTFLLDSEDLRPTGIEFLDHNVESISRTKIVYSAHVKGLPNPAAHIEGPGDRVSVYQTDCPEIQPRFISEETLAILGCERVDVISAAGDRLFSQPLDGDSGFGGASRDGQKFIVVEAFYGTGHNPKLRAERFTVFDVRSRKAVFSIDSEDLHGRESGRSGVALSPDGSLLAVNALGIVRLYHVPSTETGGS